MNSAQPFFSNCAAQVTMSFIVAGAPVAATSSEQRAIQRSTVSAPQGTGLPCVHSLALFANLVWNVRQATVFADPSVN